jgi:hypothetical protein
VYKHAERQIAVSVPRGMDFSGSFSAFDRFAPDKIPVKHGKNTDNTSLNVIPSVYSSPQFDRSVLARRPVTSGDDPGNGAATSDA